MGTSQGANDKLVVIYLDVINGAISVKVRFKKVLDVSDVFVVFCFWSAFYFV
jgi:hypothetical protein